jgi:hypothetical protein
MINLDWQSYLLASEHHKLIDVVKPDKARSVGIFES